MKRKFAMILAAVMVSAAAMSGCGTNGATSLNSKSEKRDANSSSASQQSSEASKGDGREMEGNLYLTGLPVVQEKETFTLFCDDGGLAEDKILYPILEEQTNIHVDLQLFPFEAAKEKKNVLLNSGDYPDSFGGWILGDSDILTQGMEEQIYIPLDDLINKYAPKVLEALNYPGVRSAMTLPDGHVYTIPYVVAEPKVTFSPYINRVWLENLKLSMPTTTEELREILRAFKTQDPNGNGQADEIPFSGDPNNLSLGTLAGWFGVNASSAGTNKYFALVDGKLEFSANKEGYKEYIKYFASLYKEGLIDPELFTQDNTTWDARSKQLVFGVNYGYGSFGEPDPETDRNEYDPLPVLKSDYAPNPVYRRNSYGATIFRTQLVITDKAKNPATIMRWWDNLFELDNSICTNAGPIGIGIEKLGEGKYRYINKDNMSEEDKVKYGWVNVWTQSLPKFSPPEIIIEPAEGEKPNKYNEKNVTDALYEPYLDETVPPVWVDADSASKLGTLETDINNLVKKKEAEWISGQKDVDAEWDAYCAELDKLGLPELAKMRSEAVAKALANQ